MAQMKLTITPSDGTPYSVGVGPKVIVECERHFKRPFSQLFSGESLSYESLAWAAWKASLAAGHEVKTFDLWLDDVDDIAAAEDDSLPLSAA
jgi:hypothetical protein